MEKKRITLVRTFANEKETIGTIKINDIIIYTLELPDLNNQKKISRIPAGIYPFNKRYSAKFNNHFEILNVENRSAILVHKGNYYYNTEGCVLVGLGLKDINKDGIIDITDSGDALAILDNYLDEENFIIVTDEDEM